MTYLILILMPFFMSCKSENENTYAVKDFRKSLQPYLTKIVSKGIVTYFDSSLRYMATDKELTQLSKSDNPILRAAALREILHKNSVNDFDVIMNHLNDTATVSTDNGEFGIQFREVSDYVLEEGEWNTMAEKNKTIHEVITKHNYLSSAYYVAQKIEPEERYYSYIKEMVKRERPYLEIESALYGLAKFKKSEDIPIIKEFLFINNWQLNELSFKLMKEYPHETFLDVYEKYYPWNFYHSICMGNNDNAVEFINSIAVYKNNRSAKILDSILNKKPFLNCQTDTNHVKYKLVYAIWNNQCKAYSKLRTQVKGRVEYHEKNKIELPPADVQLEADTTTTKIRW